MDGMSVSFVGTWQGLDEKRSSDQVKVFQVRVNDNVYNRETHEKEKTAHYINVKVFGEKQAERLMNEEWFPKGRPVFVHGPVDELDAYMHNKKGRAVPSMTVRGTVDWVPRDYSEEDRAEAAAGEDDEATEVVAEVTTRRPPPKPTAKANI